MTDGAGASEAAGMDAQGAAVIMGEARDRARHELTVDRPVIFTAWALVYLLGYGVVWLSVRRQRPFYAPEGWALALLALLAVLALGVTAQLTDRAASGVGGVSQLRRRIYWLSLAVGLLGVYVMQPALRHVGAGHEVISVFTASSPLLVAGVVLAAGTAAWLTGTPDGDAGGVARGRQSVLHPAARADQADTGQPDHAPAQTGGRRVRADEQDRQRRQRADHGGPDP
jgi:hypothetical protein